MAPDAVIRLIQRADQVGAAVSKCKSIAASQMREAQCLRWSVVARYHGNETLKVQLAGYFEQHAFSVSRAPRRGNMEKIEVEDVLEKLELVMCRYGDARS